MRRLFALLWLVVGAYCLYRTKNIRSYLSGLPDSPSNRRLKIQGTIVPLLGVAAVAIGLWLLFRA